MELREIKTHHVNVCNEALCLSTDDRGTYYVALSSDEADFSMTYHQGEVNKISDVNGITNELLLAIVIDRLETFQRGEYACPENEHALGNLRFALDHLRRRTKEREARGVEGKLVP